MAEAQPKTSQQPAPQTRTAAPQSGLDVVMERNEFYRDGYRRMQVITIASVTAALMAIVIAGIALFSKPEPRYFATDREGRIIPLVPLNKPYQNNNAVLGWSSEAIMKTLALDFVHYRRTLNESREFFTDAGWDAFLKALKDSGLVDAMIQQKQVLSATPTDAAVIIAQGELRGRYTWKVKQPFLLKYSTNTEERTQKVIVNLTVVRVPTTVSVKGLGIQQIIMEDAV